MTVKPEPLGIVVQPAHDKRFCGRCQTWLPDAIELHACAKAPRLIGYAWHEPDEPAFEKNSILTDGRKFKRGALIQEFHASSSTAADEKRSHIAIEE